VKTAGYFSSWRPYAPAFLWSLVILILSGNAGTFNNSFVPFNWLVSLLVTLDPDTLNRLHFFFRKMLHFICYGVLGVLWFRALMASCPERPGTNHLLALALCLAVALTDEWRQRLIPGRTASIWDVGLDMAGGLVFLMVARRYWGIGKRIPPETRQPPLP
jgi:VanZ family protein